MIPQNCRRLAEVDFPMRAVGENAVREKAGPKGHPSMLFLWWARRPLASSRSVLLAMLLPDPMDTSCPAEFKAEARRLLRNPLKDESLSDSDLRARMLDVVAQVSPWDASAGSPSLAKARALVAAAYPERPTVVDPFSGGGSIPLEALRLGCESFASDLNPVAITGLRVLLQDIPARDGGLSRELIRAGNEIQADLEKRLSAYYAEETGGYRPIAYLWARTVQCETPNCGMEIPLTRSLWLAKKGKRKTALRYHVEESDRPHLRFEVFSPHTDSQVQRGTTSKAKASCPRCQSVMPPERVRYQLERQTGGGNVIFGPDGRRAGGATLLAVVRNHPTKGGRDFRVASESDYIAVRQASLALEAIDQRDPSLIPTESLPPIGTLGFRVQRYGITQWGHLFTHRQLLSLLTLKDAITATASQDDALRRSLALAFGRVAMSNMSLTRWNPVGEKMQHTFGRQALPIVWDFAEVLPTAEAPGNWRSGFELVSNVIEAWPSGTATATVQQADACEFPLPDASAQAWFTDPPYYDAIPYSDLSDFFYVWLKRLLGSDAPRDPFDKSNALTPKTREAVQDETKTVNGKPKDKAFFEDAMARAFAEGRRVLVDDGIGCVVFAHKTTEGWEALLSGMIRGGWVITTSWPIATEMSTRLRARDSAALATSVHLLCRPRTDDRVGDWSDVSRELPSRVSEWMDRLAAEGVRGADLVFACIGPAMEIYSRYSRVLDPEDREIPLGGNPEARAPHEKGYLAHVWEVVGRLALERVLGTTTGGRGNLEEDARLTALFLWSLQSSAKVSPDEIDDDSSEDEEGESTASLGGYSMPYDIVRRFAQPLGIHLDQWEGRITETDKGVVRLLPLDERANRLFGAQGVASTPDDAEAGRRFLQVSLLPEEIAPVPVKAGKQSSKKAKKKTTVDFDASANQSRTTLDRLHIALLLQQSGKTAALAALLSEERARGPDFERLANALNALYPEGAEERRLIEAMLLTMPE